MLRIRVESRRLSSIAGPISNLRIGSNKFQCLEEIAILRKALPARHAITTQRAILHPFPEAVESATGGARAIPFPFGQTDCRAIQAVLIGCRRYPPQSLPDGFRRQKEQSGLAQLSIRSTSGRKAATNKSRAHEQQRIVSHIHASDARADDFAPQ